MFWTAFKVKPMEVCPTQPCGGEWGDCLAGRGVPQRGEPEREKSQSACRQIKQKIKTTFERAQVVFLFLLCPLGLGFFSLAERGGFEPPIPFWGIRAFQAGQFNHSCISPFVFKGVQK